MTDEKKPDSPLEKLASKLDELGPMVMLDDIEWPIQVAGIMAGSPAPLTPGPAPGTLVRVRLASDDDSTYTGVYLGELMAFKPDVIYLPKLEEVRAVIRRNPAIFVPALRRVVWGYESWWGEIERTDDEDRDITDEQIRDVWYMKMLRQLSKIDKAEVEAGQTAGKDPTDERK